MAVKIRLKRVGTKKAPHYRVVVMDSRQPRDGRTIDNLGRYNPRTNPVYLALDKEKCQEWLGNGAIPTDVVKRLFGFAGLENQKAKKVKKAKIKKTAKKTTAAVKE